MKLGNHGFLISSIVYALIVVFILVLMGLLWAYNSQFLSLKRIKDDLVDEIEVGESLSDYLVDNADVGDFVDYDSHVGTWSTTVSMPTSQGNFGGYTAGNSKGTSVTCHSTYVNQYSGWQVSTKTGSGEDGVVTLISAGTPECYYHSEGNGEASRANLSVARATTNYGTNLSISVKYLGCGDLTIFGNYANMCKEHSGPSIGEPLVDNELVAIGGWYWLTYEGNESNDLWKVVGNGQVFISQDAALGIRPIVTLKTGIKKTSGNGTSNKPWEIYGDIDK